MRATRREPRPSDAPRRRRSPPEARSARPGFRPGTTTSIWSSPSALPDCSPARFAKDSSREHQDPAHPRDHGIRRDRAHDGHPASRDRRAPGRPDATRRVARHPLWIPGERGRDHRAGGRVLRASHPAHDRGGRLSRSARGRSDPATTDRPCRRALDAMEAMLPDDAWVLGIDEHTVLTVDLDSKTAVVSGRGGLTVRRRGASRVFPAGERITLDALLAAARGVTPAAGREPEPAFAAEHVGLASNEAAAPGQRSPLLTEVTRLEQAFEAAIAGRKASEAAEAILNLDRAIAEGSADTPQTDDPDPARARLYSLVQRLGEAGAGGPPG